MRETENGVGPSGVQPESKRARAIRLLTAEIDYIKREIERSKGMRNRSRILYEFERPSPFHYIETKYVHIPKRDGGSCGIDEATRVEMAMNYILDARTVMLSNVLRQSKKMVFSSEWRVAHNEGRITTVFDKIDAKRRRNKLFRISGDVTGVDKIELEKVRNRMLDMERERTRKMRLIKQELMCLTGKKTVHSTMSGGVMYGNGIIPQRGGDNPPRIFMARSWDQSSLERKRTNPKEEPLEVFKRHLSNFTKCNSSQSNRNSFQMLLPSTGVHPSNQYIFKKIPGEYLRCKSARELVDYKYRNVVVEKAAPVPRSYTPRQPFDLMDDDSLKDLCSSKSDKDMAELSIFLDSDSSKIQDKEGLAEENEVMGGKINLETSFDKFLSEGGRREGGSRSEDLLHGPNPRFTDFIKDPPIHGQVGLKEKESHPKFINEFYRSFPGRIGGSGRMNFETVKDGVDGDEAERRCSSRDNHPT